MVLFTSLEKRNRQETSPDLPPTTGGWSATPPQSGAPWLSLFANRVLRVSGMKHQRQAGGAPINRAYFSISVFIFQSVPAEA